jgi:carbon monoxide dehydrogenase subunit G
VRIEGERTFDASPERVFEALTTADTIAGAVPGVRDPRVVDETHWTAKVKPPLPFAPRITIRFEVLDRQPPTKASLRAVGGGADITSDFELEPDADGGTRMRWSATVQLGGVLSAFGGQGLEPVARRQAERTLDRLAERMP